MSAPNANNTAPAAPAANPSSSSSVPKWGEPGFIAVDGARFGEDGFVPCGRLGHSRPRADLHHTAHDCVLGGPISATNRVHRTRPARGTSYPSRGRSRQHNFAGSGQQHSFPGHLGQQDNTPGFESQAVGLGGLAYATLINNFTVAANNIAEMHRSGLMQQEQQQQQPSLSIQQL
jgi:hypothetical protein